MSKIIILVIFFIDTQPSIGFSDSQDKEIYEGTTKCIALLLVDAFLSLCCCELTLVLSFASWFAGAPPAKKAKLSQDECIKLSPSDEMLGDLAKDITSFWKHLGRKLKIANENIEEIQADNVQYPGVREKSFQMLMVWKNNVQSATITELSRALKALGKNRIEVKYCSGSSFMDNTAI